MSNKTVVAQIQALLAQIVDESPPGIVGLSVVPTVLTLMQGEIATFTAQGWMTGSNIPISTPVTWTATGGTITPAGVFTAGDTDGLHQVRAVSTLPLGHYAMSLVTVKGKKIGPGTSTESLSLTVLPTANPVNDTVFPQQPVVQLRDASGVPKSTAGVTITATVVPLVGTEVPVLGGDTTKDTNGSGVATFTDLKLTGLVGAYTLVFTATDYTQVAANVVMNVAPAVPTKAGIRTNPAGAVSGVAFTTQPVIEIQDASGNLVTSSTLNVVATIGSGSGSLSGIVTVAAIAGVATFTNLAITGTGGHTLTFTPTGLTPATSTTVTVQSAGATGLAMATQPATAVAGSPFGTQPGVQAITGGTIYSYAASLTEDPVSDGGKWSTATGGTPLKTASGTFQASNPAVLCSSYVDPDGLATVSSDHFAEIAWVSGTDATVGVAVREQGNGACYQWFGSTDGTASLFRRFADGSQSWFDSVDHVFIATDRLKALPIGNAIHCYINDIEVSFSPKTDASPLTGGRPQAMIYGDGQGDTFSAGSQSVNAQQSGLVVTASKVSGPGNLTGTLGATTNAQGLATWTNLGADAAGSYVIRFTSGAMTVDSAVLVVTSGAATQLIVTTQPASAVDGFAFSQQPSVQRRDASNNPVLVAGVSIAASKFSGPGGAIGGTTGALTNAQGVATWTNLSYSNGGAGGSYVTRFIQGALTVDSQVLTVTPVAPPSPNYPNRPGSCPNVLTDYAFGTAIPPSPPAPNDRAIPDGSGWAATGSLTIVTDATDPVSPSSVLNQQYPPTGLPPGPPPNTYANFSAGKVYHALPQKTELYIAFPVWHSPNATIHPISNKMCIVNGTGSPALGLNLESKHGDTFWVVQAANYPTPGFTTLFEPNVSAGPNPVGAWHKLEIHIKYGSGGWYKLWINGTLVTNTTGLSLQTGLAEIFLDGTWGGGGGFIGQTWNRRIGHIFIATN